MKEFRPPRNVKMVDGIRVNWNTVITNIEQFIDSKYCKSHWDDKIRAVGVLMDIKRCYRNDDLSQYLEILEGNRDIINREIG